MSVPTNKGLAATVLGLALACAGCSPERMAEAPFVPHAASGTVSWEPLVQRDVSALHGGPTVEVRVKGGELLRLETETDAPVAVGQRVHASSEGDVEEWTTVIPRDHEATIRPALFTTAVLLPKGVVSRALLGHGFEPGYRWFELESRVLDWAEGPLPAPFPQIAPPERIDVATIARVDRALADAVAAASNRDDAMNEARAIRRVIGLRAARLLRPVSGFPYFFDTSPEPEGHPRRLVTGEHVGYELTPQAPLSFVVTGPTLLHLWSRAPRSEEGEVEHLRVTEGGRERATSGATLPHVILNTTSDPSRPDAESDDPAGMASLRRAVVHVPPGEHRYQVEMSGGPQLWVYPLLAREIVHLEDGIVGIKSETRQLASAEDACRGGSPTICALALALGGKDDGEAEAPSKETLGWQEALSKLSPAARSVAVDLARGGPHDPSLAVEVAASAGDPDALAKLDEAAARETDDVLRDSWMRAVLRGSRWSVNDDETHGSWTELLVDDSSSRRCAGVGEAPWTELGREDATVAASPWRGGQAVDLVANVPCDARGPVQLVVDGETLTVSPSSAHARWHVVVHGTAAHARRLDSSGGRVLAMRAMDASCGARWERIAAPSVANSHPKLGFDAGTRAPGIEVWLRENATSAQLGVTGEGGQKALIFVRARRGVAAMDEHGTRWTRVARLPLPAWAAATPQGVIVDGGEDVAVRAIARTPRSGAAPESPKPAEPLDEARLVELSRAILALPPEERGPAYLQRAYALAAGGAERAALADAREAKALGAAGDPEAQVRAAIRTAPSKPLSLPSSVRAYGVESDFDPGAPRCSAADAGPRAKLTQLEEQLKARTAAHTWDPSLAVRALELARANPNDPRAETLARRSLWGSKWQSVRSVQGAAPRVLRPREIVREGPVDGSGELRDRVAAGDPFGRTNYVTVTAAHAARAILTGAPGTSSRVDLVCVARDPHAAKGARCPVQVMLGESPATLENTAGGALRAKLPPLPERGDGARLAITMREAPGEWFALARIVFDKEVPGSTKVDGVGWVLEPPPGGHRFLLRSGARIALATSGPGLIRVDALPEPNSTAHVIVTVDGHDEVVPLDGTQVTVPTWQGVAVRAEGGAATVSLAERVPRTAAPASETADEEPEPTTEATEPPEAGAEFRRAGSVILDANDGDVARSWRSIALHSPRPLTRTEDDLGVFVGQVSASYAGFRADDPNDTSTDESLGEYIGYRRRIERWSLWTISQVNAAERPSGAPTYGASLTLYEDYDPGHFRASGTFDWDSQQIEGQQVNTFNPRGFLEYSWRATRAFFILPRLGFDGWYTTLHRIPKSTVNVDDDVYNGFRTQRQTFAFLQSLFWLTPFFNDIYYIRLRATYDVGNSQLSHFAVRPGVLLAFGQLDVNGYFDSTWYQATPTVRATAGITNTAGLTIDYTFWSGAGSLGIQPGVEGLWADTGAYTVEGFLAFQIGYRRGLRDFSSLELDFPEQLSDGVPWRGAPVGVPK